MSDVNKQLLDALSGYGNIVRIVLNGLRRDYEERGMMIRKEFHDELSAAHAKACEAVFDAKEEMKAIAAAEQAQQAEPRCACGDSFTSDAVCANCLCAQPVAVPDGLLSADDMNNLRRFAECCEDFEAGGHDVPKAAMKRLELAGAVRSCGFGRHETTSFGNAMLSAAKNKDGA